MSHPGYVAILTWFRPHALPMIKLFGVAIFLVWPALLPLGAAIPGHPQSDAYEHVHGYRWVADSLAAGRLPWRVEDFGVPVEGVLWFPDTLGALLALPVTLLAGAPVAYTLTVTAQVLASVVAAYALGFHISRNRGAACFSAVVFGASPYVLGLIHSGVSEYLHLAAFPIFWLAAESGLRGERRGMAAAVLAWAWLGWANAYYPMFAAFILPMVWLTMEGRPRAMEALRRGLIVAAAAGLLVLPVAVAIQGSVSADGALVRQESAPGWSWVTLPANDLAGFFWPGDKLFPDLSARGNFGIRHVTYPGWVAVVVAAMAWRRWGAAMALAAVLAAGPSLHWRGQPVRVGGEVVPLPGALLYLPGSPFRAVHHPYRLVVLPSLVLAAAGAYALRNRPRLALAGAALVLGETVVASPAAGGLSIASLDGVATLPGAGGVWDLPADFGALNRRWMGLQAVHGRPIPYTINVFLPEPWRENRLYQSTMGCLRESAAHTRSRDGWPPLAAWLQTDSTQTGEAAAEEIRGWGIRYVIVHHDVTEDRERVCIETVLRGAGGVDVPAAGEGLTAFDFGGEPAINPVRTPR